MLSFTKLNVAGNDFVLLDGRTRLRGEPAALARAFCPRRVALGADGLLLVEQLRGPGPGWGIRHYEPDGERTFCLNGVRAGAAWLASAGLAQADEELLVCTDRGDLPVRAVPEPNDRTAFRVEVSLPAPERVESMCLELADGLCVLGTFVDVGNPQFVVVLDDVAALEDPHLMIRARSIRHHRAFAAGTNVCFVAVDGDGWRVRTFERGVEDETLSCGTGTVAAAAALTNDAAPLLAPVAASGAFPLFEPPARGAARSFTFRPRGGGEQRVVLPDGSSSARVRSVGPVRLVGWGELWEPSDR